MISLEEAMLMTIDNITVVEGFKKVDIDNFVPKSLILGCLNSLISFLNDIIIFSSFLIFLFLKFLILPACVN